MSLLIYLIAFLEGFTTLSIEIIAIRNFTPIIGTNSISTSIILGVILLALSYGYYIGGKKSNKLNKDELKKRISLNLALAGFYYIFITFILDKYILTSLLEFSGNYFISILISSFILFFIPVFLASQTIPLLSEILKGNNTGEKMGKLLFFSTIGSFMGSVLTSSFLFPIFGVEKSATINSLILGFLSLLIIFKYINKISTKYFVLPLLIIIFSLSFLLTELKYNENIIYKEANSYHNIVIKEFEGKRVLIQNGGLSSGIYINSGESYFKYIKELKEKTNLEENNKNVLIIGAAGFTLPNELAKIKNIQNIDVVDVDKNLKEITEKYFLQKELSEKIKFYSEPSRFFLNKKIKENVKYDSIVVDIYVGKSLAPQTLTYEFFKSLNQLSENVYLNIITDKNLESDFSIKLFSTLDKAFGEIYYKDVNQYKNKEIHKTNFIVTNKNFEEYIKFENTVSEDLYHDDKNSIELDIFKNK